MRLVKAIFVSLVVLVSLCQSGSARILGNNNVVPETPMLTPKTASDSVICIGSFGGPNGYGYTWIDSDTAGGPTYNWIEISTIGTRIEDGQWHSPSAHPLDDGTAGPFPVGFSFPYNHSVFDSVYIGTNGIISFSDTNLTSGGYFYHPAQIPHMIFFNPLAVFWNDLSLDPNTGHGGGDVYYWTNSLDTFIVEYKNVKPYSDSLISDTVTFQIILSKRDSCIIFQYQSVVTPNTWYRGERVHKDSSAVIGIQDQTKRIGLQYFNGDTTGEWFTCYNNLPHSGLVVKFKKTLQVEHNLFIMLKVLELPLVRFFHRNTDYDPYLVYCIKEVGDLLINDTVRVFNIGKYVESNFPVVRLISIRDSLGNYNTIDSASVLVSTTLLPYDSCEVAFSTGWQPEARGFYLVTYIVALPTDQISSDDTACGLLVAERTKVTSNWADTLPNCDGIIGPGEWDDATKFDISYFAMENGVLVRQGEHHYDSSACFTYVKNDSHFVYLAFDVPKDTHDTQLDFVALFIDDNSDSWFEADSSEGNFYVWNHTDAGSDSLYFMALVSTDGCWAYRINIQYPITNWESAITNNNGHQQFEIAIPMGTDPKWRLNCIPGDSIGVSLLYCDRADSFESGPGDWRGNAVGYWPATSVASYYPCKMGKIYLSQSQADVEDISEKGDIPEKYALFQNYPNPFNPQTRIQYDLPKGTEVRLTIYNILGQRVKTLVDEHQKAGHKEVLWDGKDEKREEVSSGIYFYRLQAGDFNETKKMVIIK